MIGELHDARHPVRTRVVRKRDGEAIALSLAPEPTDDTRDDEPEAAA